MPHAVAPFDSLRMLRLYSSSLNSYLRGFAGGIPVPEQSPREWQQVYTKRQFAKMLDHTLLKPTATRADVIRFCDEAKKLHFCAVVVLPYWLPVIVRELDDTDVKPCTVVDFPYGAGGVYAKLSEARRTIGQGAQELDVVMNISAFKSGDEAVVQRELEELTAAVSVARMTQGEHRVLVKVIIETAYLSEREKIRAAEIVREAGADFVKTSTGTAPTGATSDDILLIRRVVGPDMGVKAAGGIRTMEQAMAMFDAGANRIGTSCAVEIAQSFDPQAYLAGTG